MKNLIRKAPSIPLHPLVQGLGWFSLALGVAELLAPRQVSKGAGMHKQDSLLRGYGLREIATGIGILTAANPRPWLWGRVAGDMLDVATVALTADKRKPARLGISSLMLLGVGALDMYSALKATPKRLRTETQARTHDYSGRSGFPKPASAMRGLARSKPTDKTDKPGQTRMHAAE